MPHPFTVLARTLLVTAGLTLATLASSQTLIIAPNGVPNGLDSVTSARSLSISNNITETLVGFLPGTTTPAPRLAIAWESNEDASVWTFTLREGVRFHDGTPFDAEAVKFNFERWNIADHPYGFRAEGTTYTPWSFIFGGTEGDGSLLARVEVLGEHRVAFYLTRPTPNMPLLTGVVYFQLSSPTAIIAAGVDYGSPSVGTIGTGPFQFERWIDAEGIVLSANADYWDGAPKLERVIYRFIPDGTARHLALLAGSVDVAASLPSDELASLRQNPAVVPIIEEELNLGLLGLNQAFPPLDNPLVRRAIAHAIDREALVDAFLNELGVVAEGFVHPAVSASAIPWPYAYDPQRAIELLREAGLPDGFDISLYFRSSSHAVYPSPGASAETIASYLNEVGIRARVETSDPTTFNSLRRRGEFSLFQSAWTADFADPDNFLMTLFGPVARNEFGWDDPDVRETLARARLETDPAERARLYASVERVVAEQVIAIPLAHSRALHGRRSNIENWSPSPLGFWWAPLHQVVKR
jgi:peptide/nickel transport system substrate-binding protein